MSDETNILGSFGLQDTLNPKIWENADSAKDSRMKPKVREALMKIAEKFQGDLSEDLKVDDVILTGSLANFNWSRYSDFDLHLVIDYKQFKNQSELYEELFQLKKQLFNNKHDIKIFGYEVELYPQDAEEQHFSSGVYSVQNDKWVKTPSKKAEEIDRETLRSKANSWKQKIETLISDIKKNGLEKSETKLKTFKDKLKEYRTAGLEKGGEFSYENLVFKYLRRSGLIEKLYDTVNKQSDKELSVEARKID
jgi:predicted nucleotidyltransferase